MRISDWSSDVCSSDLQAGLRQLLGQRYGQPDNCLPWASIADLTAMLRTAQTVQIRRSTLPCHIGQNRSRPTGRDRAATSGRPNEKAHRSEEHTSELQSLMRISYAVFCLKKKKKTHTPVTLRYKA